MTRTKIVAGITALLMLVATPAWADSEAGYRSCSTNDHVYTRAKWQGNYLSWIDIEADGLREFIASDNNGGNWEVDYANAYRSEAEHGNVKKWIDNGFYYISGTVLSHLWSWPGCEDD